MANDLRIYSGPGQLTFWDATNGYLRAGYIQDIQLNAKGNVVEKLDGSLKKLFTVYDFDAVLVNSDQALLDGLATREATAQKIYVVGLESLLELSNMNIVHEFVRSYGKEPHRVKISGRTQTDADVVLKTNLIGADGKFETDGDSDGIADGWAQVGITTKNLTTSFLTGGGNAQRIIVVDTGDYLYYDVTAPVVDTRPLWITFSAYIKENANAPATCEIWIELLDESSTLIESHLQVESFEAWEQRRVSLAKLISPTAIFTKIRVKVTGFNSVADLVVDNAQLEFGELSSFTDK
ncbi:MAG: hypothetical protein ACE5IR_16180 [bacterium]